MDEWRMPGFVEVRELGSGGQGRAVLVREDGSGRVAVAKYVETSGDDAARDQFRNESVLLKRVHSPYVARWYGHYEGPSVSAILMEAVDGVSLKEVLDQRSPLAPEAALLVLKGSLLGLEAAHDLGVVHRDYKPANVIVRADGLSKLIDFGVATLAGEQARSGTPAYMAPEQWRGEPAMPATDTYAATCVFFECITGHRPYQASDLSTLRAQHMSGPIPVEAVPEAVRDLVERGLAKDPHQRPGDFVTELDMAAATGYGEDWESRGAEALATTAAALAVLFPLAALLAPGAAAPATIGPAVISAGARTGRSLLTRLGSAKTMVAVTAAGIAIVGGSVLYAPGSTHKPAVRPSPLQAIRVQTDSLDQAFTSPHLTIKGAQYAHITGMKDLIVQNRVNKALRAPIDLGIAAAGIVPCQNAQTLQGTVEVGLQQSHLLSVRYDLFLHNICVQSGNQGWRQAVTVDLQTGQELTAQNILETAVVTSPTSLVALMNPPPGQHGNCTTTPLGVAPLTSTDFQSEQLGPGGLTHLPLTVFLKPDALEVTRDYFGGDGCDNFTYAFTYAKIRGLLRPEITTLLAK